MSFITFIIVIGITLAILFLIVRTVQSVAKAVFSLAIIGFILMVGVMIAFGLGLGVDSKLKNIKSAVAGIIKPIGKAFSFVSTTSRNLIDMTQDAGVQCAACGMRNTSP